MYRHGDRLPSGNRNSFDPVDDGEPCDSIALLSRPSLVVFVGPAVLGGVIVGTAIVRLESRGVGLFCSILLTCCWFGS